MGLLAAMVPGDTAKLFASKLGLVIDCANAELASAQNKRVSRPGTNEVEHQRGFIRFKCILLIYFLAERVNAQRDYAEPVDSITISQPITAFFAKSFMRKGAIRCNQSLFWAVQCCLFARHESSLKNVEASQDSAKGTLCFTLGREASKNPLER